MALTEQHRNTLYQGLTRTIGDEEAVAAMLSQLPAREVDEPATKELVRTVETRLEAKMDVGFAELRRDMDTGFAKVDARFSEFAKDVTVALQREMRIWIRWHFASMFVLLAAVVTAAKILQ